MTSPSPPLPPLSTTVHAVPPTQLSFQRPPHPPTSFHPPQPKPQKPQAKANQKQPALLSPFLPQTMSEVHGVFDDLKGGYQGWGCVDAKHWELDVCYSCTRKR